MSVPYVIPMREGAEQRRHTLHELVNELLYMIRYAATVAWDI